MELPERYPAGGQRRRHARHVVEGDVGLPALRAPVIHERVGDEVTQTALLPRVVERRDGPSHDPPGLLLPVGATFSDVPGAVGGGLRLARGDRYETDVASR